MDINNLINEIQNPNLWVTLGIAIISGIIGGWTHKITDSNTNEIKIKTSSYIVIGIVASIAVLFIKTPSDPIKLIAFTIIAGYAGKSVLDALKSKLEAAINGTKIEDIRKITEKMENHVSEVKGLMTNISQGDQGIKIIQTKGYNSVNSLLDKIEVINSILEK
jgi:hypothetical protein